MERYDYVAAYVDDLAAIVDLEAVRGAGLRLGVDPLGGAAVDYWSAIAERYGWSWRWSTRPSTPPSGS